MSRAVKTFRVPPELKGERLDRVIPECCEDISRRRARALILEGRVQVDQKVCKVQGRPLRKGSQVRVYESTETSRASYEDFDPPEIIYEDADVVVINKPTGIAVQPAKSPSLRDLVSWWEFARHETLKVVHRLDVPASGVVILARNKKSAARLSEQFQKHHLERIYCARVEGNLNNAEGRSLSIEAPLDKDKGKAFVSEQGRPAKTEVEVVKRAPDYDELKVLPHTGRFHQIRVHLAHRGHPILGDRRYGAKPQERLFLHAYSLKVELPSGQTHTFTAEASWLSKEI